MTNSISETSLSTNGDAIELKRNPVEQTLKANINVQIESRRGIAWSKNPATILVPRASPRNRCTLSKTWIFHGSEAKNLSGCWMADGPSWQNNALFPGWKSPATKIPLPVALDSAFTSFIAEAASNGRSELPSESRSKRSIIYVSPRPPLRVVEFWLRSFKIPLRVQANGSSLSRPFFLSVGARLFRVAYFTRESAFRSSFVFRLVRSIRVTVSEVAGVKCIAICFECKDKKIYIRIYI